MLQFGKYRRFRRRACYALCAALLLAIYVLPFFMPDRALSEGERKAIIKEGKAMLGTPYGHGPKKLTCSEFTRLAYGRGTGVWMPANYISQRSYGWRPQRLKRGDLLTYKDHVGIYYGQGRILHSSNYWGAVVVSETQYLDGYLGPRRIR